VEISEDTVYCKIIQPSCVLCASEPAGSAPGDE
jgi:hypothetical protein